MDDRERRQKIRDLLYLKLRQSKRKMRDVSRALGWPADRLSRLLRGTHRLELDDIYSVLLELNCPPGDFWIEIEGESGLSPSLLAAIADIPPPDPELPLPGGLTAGELEDTLRRVIRDELERLRRGIRPPVETPEATARRLREAAQAEKEPKR